MTRTTEKPCVSIVFVPKKLGRQNPKNFSVDNFDFNKILDGIGNAATTVSNVANTVNQVGQTIKGTAQQVRTTINTPQQQYYTAPVPVHQPAHASMSFNPIIILMGMAVVIALFMLIRKS